MSTLQVANVHLESTGNNRIQYEGTNTFNMYAGGVSILAANSSMVTGRVRGAWTLLAGPTSVGTGTTFAVTNIPSTYNRLFIVGTDVSHNGGTSQAITISMSDNNGSTYAAGPTNISFSQAAADTFSWVTELNNYNVVGGKTVGNAGSGLFYFNSGVVGIINALRFGLSSTASFDGGTIAIYGSVI